MLEFALAAEETTINPLIPQWYDIIWSAVCFIIILAFFWIKFLPKVTKMLDDRSAAIEGGLEKAELAQAEAAAALDEYNSQLTEARQEAGRIREQARSEGLVILSELKEQASAEAARITANAQVQIEADRQAALVSLRSEVGLLALDLASGVVGQSLSSDQNSKALVDRFIADLDAGSKAGSSK